MNKEVSHRRFGGLVDVLVKLLAVVFFLFSCCSSEDSWVSLLLLKANLPVDMSFSPVRWQNRSLYPTAICWRSAGSPMWAAPTGFQFVTRKQNICMVYDT